MKIGVLGFFLFLLLVIPMIIFPQDFPSFEHLTIDDGLSQSTINAISQDSIGFIWIGTQDGLNRFDGYEIKEFRKNEKNKNSIPGNEILDLLSGTDGDLWISVKNEGLCSYHRKTNSFKRVSKNQNNYIKIIYENAHLLLLLNKDGSLENYNPINNVFTKKDIFAKTGVSFALKISAIAYDEELGLVAGTNNNSVLISQDNYFKELFFEKRPVKFSITSVFIDSKKNIWIANSKPAIYLIPNASTQIKIFEVPENQRGEIVSILEQNASNMWFGLHGKGILVLNTEKPLFSEINSGNQKRLNLSSNIITSLFKDQKNNIWVGTLDKGLNIYKPSNSRFLYLNDNQGGSKRLLNNNVTSILQDSDNNFWFGFWPNGGVQRFYLNEKNNDLSEIQFPEKFTAKDVFCLLEDFNRNIWIGTWDKGLIVYSRKKKTFSYPAPHVLADMRVICLEKDHEGRIFVGLLEQGLLVFETSTMEWQHYKNDPDNQSSISGNTIHDIFCDTEGEIWIGTSNQGLNKFNVELNNFTRHRHIEGKKGTISNNEILCINEDNQGNLWVGTSNGLNKFDGKYFESYYEENGLPNNTIYGILTDSSGYLWLSTNKGITRISNSFKESRVYDKKSGLVSNEFNMGGYYKSKNGWLWFSSTEGLVYFNPQLFLAGNSPSNLVLTGFQKFYKDAGISKENFETNKFLIDHSEYVFGFKFALLDYINPTKTRYFYRITNLNENWIELGQHRELLFTNLEAGQYNISIDAANFEGVFAADQLNMVLTINPPFWKTIWFRSVVFMLITVVLILAYRLRISFYRNQKKLLEKVVKERTNELKLKTDQLEKINSIVKSINTEVSFSSLLNQILKELNTLGNFELSASYTKEKDSENFKLRAKSGDGIDEKLCHQIQRQKFDDLIKRSIEISNDVHIVDLLNLKTSDSSLIIEGGFASLLIFEIKVEDTSSGYFLFYDTEPTSFKKKEEINTIINLKEHIRSAFIKAENLEELKEALDNLRATQEQLIHSEKMASLGQLTAGIAHEIKNPLNFVNNFSEINIELLNEAKVILTKNANSIIPDDYESIITLIDSLSDTSAKIASHGKRADSIVKGMLMHSRESSGEKILTDVNNLLDESMNLSYHGMRAKDSMFNCQVEKILDQKSEKFFVIPQDLNRVFINLISNGLDSLSDKIKENKPGFIPLIKLETKMHQKYFEIKIRDNGKGIPENILKKIFIPFFSTKATGKGTGLGLSITYDIITKEHNGTITVKSEEGEYAEFTIHLPVIK